MKAKSKALKKLGEGTLAERRASANKANEQMRKKGTFYIPANKKAGLI